MGSSPVTSPGWPNYFNYFTEIEEHFQRARGTSLFLLSPLDWALIESWKSSGVPLEAVLRGIDIAFEKWRSRRKRTQMVNSLAFCAQPVMAEAQRMADAGMGPTGRAALAGGPLFEEMELRAFIKRNAAEVGAAGKEFAEVATTLTEIAEQAGVEDDLESLDQRLTVLEQKLIAIARASQTDAEALAVRDQLNAQLNPYKSKMTAPQIAMLEGQFLERALLEARRLPRLSLFYLK